MQTLMYVPKCWDFNPNSFSFYHRGTKYLIVDDLYSMDTISRSGLRVMPLGIRSRMSPRWLPDREAHSTIRGGSTEGTVKRKICSVTGLTKGDGNGIMERITGVVDIAKSINIEV